MIQSKPLRCYSRACAPERFTCLREAASAKAGRAGVKLVLAKAGNANPEAVLAEAGNIKIETWIPRIECGAGSASACLPQAGRNNKLEEQ
jgi:hypothetical protein